MSAVVSAVKSVVNTVTDTVGTVVDSAKKIVTAVDDNIVKPIATAVDNTIKAAEKDPIGTLAKVATTIVAPELLPAVNLADQVANGVPLDKALINTGESMVVNQVVPNVGGDVANATDSQGLGNTAQGALRGLATATVQGKDP